MTTALELTEDEAEALKCAVLDKLVEEAEALESDPTLGEEFNERREAVIRRVTALESLTRKLRLV